ncbi:MAG TPA: acetate--CoA ligase family protein, partial [Porticoccaceae bacterium]|nr:acetate--CoA ligase family protein [Porticoccaceae bacterium]
GVAVELYRDVRYRLSPVDREGALAMLEGLQSAPLFKGFRGQPALDFVPIADLIALVSRIAWVLQEEVDEFELNPVIVHADNSGYTVADALMRRRPQPSPASWEDTP